MMDIEELIKKELTRRTHRFWGRTYENFAPVLSEAVFGDGKRLIEFTPLNTRPFYYLVRIDSIHPNFDDEDESFEFVHEELIPDLEDEFDYIRDFVKDDRDFPVVNLECGFNLEVLK